MTLREEVFNYLQVWTHERMHAALHIDGTPEEHDACFLVNGFGGKMDLLQKSSNEVFHSTMMDMNYSGILRNGFQSSVFEIFFNSRAPQYTDAVALVSALDRSKQMMDGFIRDAVEMKKKAKQNYTMEVPRWFDLDELEWEPAGPFGDGWESMSLYLKVSVPFDYCG